MPMPIANAIKLLFQDEAHNFHGKACQKDSFIDSWPHLVTPFNLQSRLSLLLVTSPQTTWQEKLVS